MHEHSTASVGDPPVTTLEDGSVRISAPDFALHIALRRDESPHDFVAVTLASPHGQVPVQLWKFRVALDGQRVLVGNAVATDGEAPLLRGIYSELEWRLRIDHAFTRAFRVFSAVNRDRLVRAAILCWGELSGNLARLEAQS